MVETKPNIYLTDGEGPVVFKDLARDVSIKYLPENTFDIVSMWVANDTEKHKLGIVAPGYILQTMNL